MGGTVYLAGPIEGLDYNGATTWRKTVSEHLAKYKITCLSPMRDKDYLKSVGRLLPFGYEDTLLSNNKSIVTRDRFDVQSCDVVLMNLLGTSSRSIGSMVELGWADAYRKPIVLVMEPENPHQHAFVREIPGYLVSEILQALDIVVSLLNGGNR